MSLLYLFLACGPKVVPTKTQVGVSIRNPKGTFSISHEHIEMIHEKKGNFGCEWHLNLTENGKKIFAEYTSKSVGTSLEFRVFDKKIMEPSIQEPILQGKIVLNWGEPCDALPYADSQ